MSSVITASTTSNTALTLSGDTSGQLEIKTGAGPTTAVTIDTSQNVGIGTTSPNTLVEMSGANGAAILRFNNPDTVLSTNEVVGELQFYQNDSSTPANVGISAKVTALAENTSGQTGLAFSTGTGATLAERMRITSGGDLLVGTTSATTSGLIAATPDLVLEKAKALPTIVTRAFSTTSSAGGALVLGHSNSGTLGTLTTTTSGQALGYIGFEGVNTSSANYHAAYIAAFQDGTAGATNIPGRLAFFTGGDSANPTERMRITADGEVLVGGTTSISANSGALTLQRTDAETILNLYRADTSISSGNTLGSIRFYGNDTTSNTPTQLASIEAIASGTHAAGDNPTDLVFACTNDGTGTVAEFARIRQIGASGRAFQVTQATLGNAEAVFITASAGAAGSINRSSDIGVYKHSGITNACGYQALYTEDGIANYLWVDNSDVLRISTTITFIGTTSGTVVGTQTSDERIKNIIGDVPYGLNEILAINPVEFTLKSDESNTKKLGFIAQQVMPFVPESVFDTGEVIEGEPEGAPTKLGMEYVSLIPVLVNAIKELKAELDEAKAEIQALKGAK